MFGSLSLAAAFIVSDYLIVRFPADALRWTPVKVLAVLGGIAIGVGMIGWYRQLSEPYLRAVVEQRFPVKAVEFVRQNKYGGPLFNSFDWGGYLIWSLPEIPVSVDGRGNIHGYRVESSPSNLDGLLGMEF